MADEKLLILLERLNSLKQYNPQWRASVDNPPTNNNTNTNVTTATTNGLPHTTDINLKEGADAEGSYEPSVTIVLTPNAGRQLVAARDVKAGEVLLREPSALPLLPKQGGGPTCLGCLKTLPEQDYPVCDGCGAPFCEPSCTGGLHTKQECTVIALKGMKNEDDDRVRMLRIREINTIITPLRTKLALDQNTDLLKLIACLELNLDKRKQIPKGFEIEQKMFSWSRVEEGFVADEQIAAVLKEQLGVNVEENTVLRLCSLYDTNAFDVPVSEEYSGRCRALFPITAMMNHDCVPNTQHWFIDGIMTVRAATDIPRGGAVTLNYTEVLWGTRARKAFLAYSKLFICACARCTDPTELGTHMSSLRCNKCPNGRLIPSRKSGEPHKCTDCSFSITPLVADAVVKACGISFSKTDKNSAQDLNKTLTKLERGLGPQHFICIELKHRLVQAIMKTNLQELSSSDLWKVIDLTSELLDLADTIIPGMSFFRGVMLLEHVRAATELITRYHGAGSKKKSDDASLSYDENKTFLYFPVPGDIHSTTEDKLSENGSNVEVQEDKENDYKENIVDHLNENVRKLDLKGLLTQAKEGRDIMQYAKRMPLEAYLVVMFLEKMLEEPSNHDMLNKEPMNPTPKTAPAANGETICI